MKNVYNLSEMSRAAAEQLIRDQEGELCVRFYQRHDGTVLTADCLIGARKRRVRKVALAVGIGAGAALAAGAVAATSMATMGKRIPQQERRAEAPALPDSIEMRGVSMGLVVGGLGSPSATKPSPTRSPRWQHGRARNKP